MSVPATTDRLDRRGVLLGLAALAASRPPAWAGPAEVRLGRGVNLSHWFAQSSNGYGPQHLEGFVTLEDIGRIVHAGFDHVRLGVEPDALFAKEGDRTRFSEPVLSALRRTLDAITEQGLTVVLDLHPVGASKEPLLRKEGAETFVARWSRLSASIAADGRRRVVLEILNEPEPLGGEAWWTLQGRALVAIRGEGAANPVVVSGGNWSGIEDLVARQPYADRNLIYTVHHYAPLLFTHQATTWSWDAAAPIAGLGWPLAPEAAETAAAAATKDERARGFLRDQIRGGDFTLATMEAQFDRLTRWQAEHGGVPIYVGEFGVYAKAAPAESRLAWVRSAREAFERRGWSWALWDNTPSFGFRLDAAQGKAINPDLLRALGTKPS